MKEIFAVIIVLCIGFGCSETGVSPTVEVSVVNHRAPNSDETTVVITMRNESHSTVYFTHNKNLIGFWRLERKIDNGWVDADRAAINYASFYPGGRKTLPPGEILRDSMIITQAGTYRMGFPFAWDENETEVDSIPATEFIVE